MFYCKKEAIPQKVMVLCFLEIYMYLEIINIDSRAMGFICLIQIEIRLQKVFEEKPFLEKLI